MKRFIVLLGLICLSLMGTAGPSAATGSCTGQQDHWFNGFTSVPTDGHPGVYGATANIGVRPIYLCSDAAPVYNTGGVSEWAMVSPSNNDFNYQYAQAGHIRLPHKSSVTFTEYSASLNGFHRDLFGAVGDGGTYNAEVFYDFGRGRLDMSINGSLLTWTPWDPAAAWVSGSWQAEFFGEKWEFGDDNPGTAWQQGPV